MGFTLSFFPIMLPQFKCKMAFATNLKTVLNFPRTTMKRIFGLQTSGWTVTGVIP